MSLCWSLGRMATMTKAGKHKTNNAVEILDHQNKTTRQQKQTQFPDMKKNEPLVLTTMSFT